MGGWGWGEVKTLNWYMYLVAVLQWLKKRCLSCPSWDGLIGALCYVCHVPVGMVLLVHSAMSVMSQLGWSYWCTLRWLSCPRWDGLIGALCYGCPVPVGMVLLVHCEVSVMSQLGWSYLCTLRWPSCPSWDGLIGAL